MKRLNCLHMQIKWTFAPLHFVLECAKNPVPNRQEASIVLVQTVPGLTSSTVDQIPQKNLLAPWWTLWCEGRLKTRPRAPKSPTFGLRMSNRVGWSLSPARCGSKIGRESSAQSAPEFLCYAQFVKPNSNVWWMIILIWYLSKKLTSIIGVGMARARGR